MRALVTGGLGFIGSHLVDALVDRGNLVVVWDSGVSGDNKNPAASWVERDISKVTWLDDPYGFDVIFHCAAVGRTPAAIADPVLCWDTNLVATVRLLEAARQASVKRVVLSSSNIVYASETPYKASKLAMEHAAKVYTELYGLSTICLRYSNVYGPRQSEEGIGPNAFAALRKSLREDGFIRITGDGEQSRDWTHVSDIVRANLLAADSDETGEIDICTGRNSTMNHIARLLGCTLQYEPEREGDIKHIVQDPLPAMERLGFEAEVRLEDGIYDSFPRAKV